MDASIWVSNSPDGTFTAELNVTQAGETMNKVAIDCDETPCAVTLFGDHRNGFGYTAGTPVEFGGSAEDVEVKNAAAESDDASGSNTAWWIAGGVVVVAAIAGVASPTAKDPGPAGQDRESSAERSQRNFSLFQEPGYVLLTSSSAAVIAGGSVISAAARAPVN